MLKQGDVPSANEGRSRSVIGARELDKAAAALLGVAAAVLEANGGLKRLNARWVERHLRIGEHEPEPFEEETDDH